MIISFKIPPLPMILVSHPQEKHNNMVVVRCSACRKRIYWQIADDHAMQEHHRKHIKLVPREKVAA